MKSIIKTGILLIAIFSFASTVQAQKFGYVNSAAILAELPEVKQADANLEALQKQLQKKGQGMVELLQKDYVAIQQKIERGELSPKQQEEEGKKLETRQQEIQKFDQKMQQSIMTKREELLKPILDRVNTAIQDVAKEDGFQFIFDYSAGIILYAEESQDVSTKVKAKLGIKS
ncbi:MAG: OmpH family outer membrane protein [Bacteroidetes bacterium]|nr:OmpH family outer membrane protein [Bacteroidota bacterium]